MIGNKTSIDILVEIFVHNKKKADIAKQYDISRNTITNICKQYEHLKYEFLKYENDYTQLFDLFSGEKVKNQNKNIRKIKEDDIEAIKECCLKYFYCYLDPVDVCKSICKATGIEFEDVKNYNPLYIEIENGRWGKRQKYLRLIRNLRALKKPPKNHYKVFCQYTKTEQYKNNNISYGAFYMYAREYWKDIEWDKTIGEVIDD